MAPVLAATLTTASIEYPDYTNCHLYDNGRNIESVQNMLNNLPDFHPVHYKKQADKPTVTEIIIHLGRGAFEPAKVPNGIDADYFKGRTEELARVTTEQPLIKRNYILTNRRYRHRTVVGFQLSVETILDIIFIHFSIVLKRCFLALH